MPLVNVLSAVTQTVLMYSCICIVVKIISFYWSNNSSYYPLSREFQCCTTTNNVHCMKCIKTVILVTLRYLFLVFN